MKCTLREGRSSLETISGTAPTLPALALPQARVASPAASSLTGSGFLTDVCYPETLLPNLNGRYGFSPIATAVSQPHLTGLASNRSSVMPEVCRPGKFRLDPRAPQRENRLESVRGPGVDLSGRSLIALRGSPL